MSRKQKKTLRRITLVIALLVVGAIGVFFLKSEETVDKTTVVMTLNYENSSSGLNPDNSKFNLSAFKDDVVLDTAIEEVGLENKMTSKELAKLINIKCVSSKGIDVESDNKYIDSTYKITLTLPDEYSSTTTSKELITAVCNAYKEWFVSSYVVDSKSLIINADDIQDMEYSTILDYYNMIVARGKNYLNVKEATSSAFIGEDGTTWKSLNQELSNLSDYDLKTFDQYIWENGIAKDKAWEITLLTKKNEDLSVDYDLYLANVDKYGTVVDEYRNEMTSSVLIPTYDDIRQFYMSRTKTGIDDISKSMDNYLENATSLKEKIDTNSDKIYKLENSTIESTEKADVMLLNIREKVENIFKRIRDLDDEYAKEMTDDYVQYTFADDSLGFSFG